MKGHNELTRAVMQIYTPEIVEVQDLEESLRGAGGFGSTGVAVSDQVPPLVA